MHGSEVRKRLLAGALAAAVMISCVGTPKNVELAQEYYNLGNAYLQLKDYVRAIGFFRKSISLDPDQRRAYFNLALALTETGRADEAVKELERIAAKDPENRDMLEALAYAYHAQDQDGKAIEVYRRILDSSPENASALFNLAILLWKQDSKEEALEKLQSLLGQKPDDLQARYQEARLLAELGRDRLAVGSLERYLQERPEDAKAYLLLGDLYRRLENYDLALEAYSSALAHDEKLAQAWFYSAVIYLSKIEDPERGLTALEQALELGYRDREQIKALYDSPALLEKEKVGDLLASKELLPAAATP
jgi:tetratricopeptide (TPR) repeat protein